MKIDPSNISATEMPFACVHDESAMDPKEDEIRFTMHTIFLVMSIKQPAENVHLHELQLTAMADNNPQMVAHND